MDVDEAIVQQAVLNWLNWYESQFSEPDAVGSCWLPERMEYGFTVTAPMSDASEMSLTAQEYATGNLDWYDFDVNGDINLGASTNKAISQIIETVIPAMVTFRGAPAQRFWEFEDAQVDFGSVNARPEDLARMLLIEFTLNYGNDWFVIPVDLPVGSLCRTRSLVVTNTFGERFVIPTSKQRGEPSFSWQMFRPNFVGTAHNLPSRLN